MATSRNKASAHEPLSPAGVESARVELSEAHRVTGLFAGIGGIELGLGKSGHLTELFCESDPAAVAVLQHRFPEVPIEDDVRHLEALPSSTTLLTAGFPCQDFSQAGRTAGLSGKHSSLVRHVFRLLSERRVPWVLLENVSFMLRLDGGRAFATIVSQLESLGYSWAYRVIDSRAFGLPQRRKRVFLLAALRDAGSPWDVLLTDDAGEPDRSEDHRSFANGFYWTEGNWGLGWAVNAIPTLKGGSSLGIVSPPAIWMPDGRIVLPNVQDAERLQGFPSGWTSAAARISGREGARWRLIGNAVSVDIAEWIGARLSETTVFDRSSSQRLGPGDSWPTSAWSDAKGRRYAAPVSEWPYHVPSEGLLKFLAFDPTPLSERATRGFISRARASRLRFPEGFLDALSKHLQAVTVSS